MPIRTLFSSEAKCRSLRLVKLKKTNWLKRFKAVPKTRNLDQNTSDSESDIWDSYLENIVLDIQPFYIRPYVPVDIISGVSFNFKFSSRKSQSQQKLGKKWIILQYSFAQKTSLILRISTHLTLKRICSRKTQPKTFLTLQISQQNLFCLVSEKRFALHHFLTPQNCILEALWKQA